MSFPLSPSAVNSDATGKHEKEASCELGCHLLLLSVRGGQAGAIPGRLNPSFPEACLEHRPDRTGWRTIGKVRNWPLREVSRSAGPLNNRYNLISPVTPALCLVITLWRSNLLSRLMRVSGSYTSSRGHKQKLWVVRLSQDKLQGLWTEELFLFSTTCIASPFSVLLVVCGCWSRCDSPHTYWRGFWGIHQCVAFLSSLHVSLFTSKRLFSALLSVFLFKNTSHSILKFLFLPLTPAGSCASSILLFYTVLLDFILLFYSSE